MIQISEMSRTEKLSLMEQLWADLRSMPGGFESPAWHAELLEARQRGLENGTERILDWEEAKRRIRAEIS